MTSKYQKKNYTDWIQIQVLKAQTIQTLFLKSMTRHRNGQEIESQSDFFLAIKTQVQWSTNLHHHPLQHFSQSSEWYADLTNNKMKINIKFLTTNFKN